MLKTLPSESVHTVVTSPPYYGLRDYGVPGQLGLEPTLADYLDNMVAVFREVRRVLRSDGTLWLNIGDSYATGAGAVGNCPGGGAQGEKWAGAMTSPNRMPQPGYKPKDLMGVPWRLAFALQADGWYLRSEIIWHKKSCMPESVRDRPTKSHEHIFLLAKSESYYYDQVAASEPVTGDPEAARNEWNTKDYEIPGQKPQKRTTRTSGKNSTQPKQYSHHRIVENVARARESGADHDNPFGSTRNWRDVWSLGPEPFKEAHFATFPTEIPRRAIVAGTSEKGCCASCGAPWVRDVERIFVPQQDVRADRGVRGADGQKPLDASNRNQGYPRGTTTTTTTGWHPSCECHGEFYLEEIDDPATGPGATIFMRRWRAKSAVLPTFCATVLDPFLGSGTTALVADRLQRDCIGIELNPAYADMAERRIRADSPLFSEVA